MPAGTAVVGRRGLLLAVVLAVAMGLWLRWPSVDGGFRGDDYVQVSALRGHFAVPRAPWDLFRFDGRDAAEQAALRAQGYHPWWADEDLRLSMFRPLSSLLMALDYQLFSLWPRGYHLHSMCWWALLMAAAAFCLRQWLPPAATALAVWLFALDACHDVPVAWVANRSTLVAGSFGLLALGLYLRAVARPATRAARLAPWAPVPALLAGEYAMPVLAFILAHAALAPGLGGARARSLRALPVTLWGGGYLWLRHATGHGIAASGYYMSPLHAPGAYLSAAAWRVPALLANAVFGVPVRPQGPVHGLRVALLRWLGTERYGELPSYGALRWVAGIVGLAVLVGIVAWALWVAGKGEGEGVGVGVGKGEGEGELAGMGWVAFGVLLGCVPAAGSIAEERLLLAPAFGVSALLANLIVGGWHARRPVFTSLLGVGALLMHALLPGLTARFHAAGFAQRSRTMTRYCLEAELPTEGADEVGAYVLAAADFTTAANLVYARDVHGLPQPAFYRRLSGATQAHDLHRTGPATLEVTILSSRTNGAFTGSLYRATDRPIVTGERFSLPGLQVEVLGAHHGQPWKLRFRFDRSLSDPHLLLLHEGKQGLRRVEPPAVGETLRLPRPLSPP